MAQNTSSAVMQQRGTSRIGNLDDFPTPPWATRALVEHVLIPEGMGPSVRADACWEPTCNRGYMVKALNDYFPMVYASDVEAYGVENQIIHDFIGDEVPICLQVPWIVTNPPFAKAEAFVDRALGLATTGVCMLVRTSFLEGGARYNNLFRVRPPHVVAQFSERVPMVKGRYDPKASTATSYCWVAWFPERQYRGTLMRWIPPCRRDLEHPSDFFEPGGTLCNIASSWESTPASQEP
jgi:hypothetical protein